MITIGSGSKGESVKDWQGFLISQCCLGADGKPLSVDGDFGKNTKIATMNFQKNVHTKPDGVVGPATIKKAIELGFVDHGDVKPTIVAEITGFVQARNFTTSQRANVRLIVVHTMEAPKSLGRAKQVASWFASENAPQASAHYCVDNREVWQCVREKDIAWHAPNVNSDSIGIEHAGYAAQNEAEWLDEYNENMLRKSARLVASLCSRYSINPLWLSERDLLRGSSGICGHYDVTLAYNHGQGHTDPGPSFPKQKYAALVRSAQL